MPKICKLQDAQKCRPRAEFGIWQDGSSNFHERIRFWAFQLAILAGKAIFSTFLVAPPVIILEISKISETIIGGATRKVLKMAFPNNMARWKAQNLILPSCKIPNSARGRHFWASWILHIFGFFYIGKKIYVSWVWKGIRINFIEWLISSLLYQTLINFHSYPWLISIVFYITMNNFNEIILPGHD